MKLRADKFYNPAPNKTIEKIQERIQQYTPTDEFKNTMKEKETDLDKSNYVLTLYLRLSYDEGYSDGLKQTKKENDNSHLKMQVKNRKKNHLNNEISDEDQKELISVVQRRLKSKRMRLKMEKIFEDKGMKFEEENFALSIAINTGYEFGYYASQRIDDTINFMLNGDKEKIDMFKDLFGELIGETLEK